MRVAACWLSDIAWRVHPEYRSEVVFTRVLGEQFSGLDHVGPRISGAHLARALSGGPRDRARCWRCASSCRRRRATSARILGLALRLGITLAGACAGTLPQCPLSIVGDKVKLQVPKGMRSLTGEPIDKRLEAVADALERSHRITLI